MSSAADKDRVAGSGPTTVAELGRLENMIADLKVQYEQYFGGVLPVAPDGLHREVKKLFRSLTKAPFKNSALNFRLKTLKSRYDTFDSYWRRVLNEREAGTYSKDVFRANMREKFAAEDVKAQTGAGRAEKSLQNLFNAYRSALEKQTGGTSAVNYEAFQKNLLARARDYKEKNKGKKLTFKVVVKDGKVRVQAKVKEKAG